MKLQLMKILLENYNQMDYLLEQKLFEELLEVIEKNQTILEEIQKLKTEGTEESSEVINFKKQLNERHKQLLIRLENLKDEIQPKLLNMRQKVKASQTYNNMQKNFY